MNNKGNIKTFAPSLSIEEKPGAFGTLRAMVTVLSWIECSRTIMDAKHAKILMTASAQYLFVIDSYVITIGDVNPASKFSYDKKPFIFSNDIGIRCWFWEDDELIPPKLDKIRLFIAWPTK